MKNDSKKIVGVMTEITKVAESAAASSQEVSASTEEQISVIQNITASTESMNRIAEELKGFVSRFRL
jgi:methyl-accepting chemotaxis protein